MFPSRVPTPYLVPRSNCSIINSSSSTTIITSNWYYYLGLRSYCIYIYIYIHIYIHIHKYIYIYIYIYQLQLFGSKVILAATHEQALLFPWERGWAGGQFDLVKFVSRSIKRWTIHPCHMCLMICSWNQNKKKQQQKHHKNLEQFTQMIYTPSNQSTGWVGWELFVLGSSIQYYLAKMATMRVEQQRNKVLTSQLNNWSTNPYHSRPKISEPITVVWQQSDLSCNTRASSFVPLRTWVSRGSVWSC